MPSDRMELVAVQWKSRVFKGELWTHGRGDNSCIVTTVGFISRDETDANGSTEHVVYTSRVVVDDKVLFCDPVFISVGNIISKEKLDAIHESGKEGSEVATGNHGAKRQRQDHDLTDPSKCAR